MGKRNIKNLNVPLPYDKWDSTSELTLFETVNRSFGDVTLGDLARWAAEAVPEWAGAGDDGDGGESL